jgi:hypothetical protein
MKRGKKEGLAFFDHLHLQMFFFLSKILRLRPLH